MKRAALALGAGAALAVAAPTAAQAESPVVPAYLASAGMRFLAFDQAEPPIRGVLCIVDSGNNSNPDTQSAVVERLAVDGGGGGDIDTKAHGTLMAMVAAAPSNGWGMVGAWPKLRILSVRAATASDGSFLFRNYARAARRCVEKRGSYPVRAVSLSLGGGGPTGTHLADLRDRVQEANFGGISVVAAAGNDGGAVQQPAATEGVIGVGAHGPDRTLCNLSARGSGLDITAPGCPVESANPFTGAPEFLSGTSPAAARTATCLVALRSYRPDLAMDDAEDLIIGTADQGLDCEQAFLAAGLESVVNAGNAAADAAERVSGGPAPNPKKVSLVLRRPKIKRLKQRGRRVTIEVKNRPKGAILEGYASIRRLKGEFRGVDERKVGGKEKSMIRLTLTRGTRIERLRLRYVDFELSSPYYAADRRGIKRFLAKTRR